MQFSAMTVKQLKLELDARGLSSSGSKNVLLERLDAHQRLAVAKTDHDREGLGNKGTKRKVSANDRLDEDSARRRTRSRSESCERSVLEAVGRDGKRTLERVEEGQVKDDVATTATATFTAATIATTTAATTTTFTATTTTFTAAAATATATAATAEEEEEEEEKKTAKIEKMQKQKLLMQKQKLLAEKMKQMKKQKQEEERQQQQEEEEQRRRPSSITATTTTTTQPAISIISAKEAIERARETAARLAAQKPVALDNTNKKFEKTGPAPVLRVNEKGQEVDEHGKVIVRAKDFSAATKVNEKQKMREAFLQAEREVALEEMRMRGDLGKNGYNDDEYDDSMIDPEMAKVVGKGRRDRKESFKFVEKGMYEKAADFTRLTHKFGEVEAIRIRKREDRERQRAEHTEALEAAVAGQTKTKPDFEQIVQEFPLDDGIEWWDKPFIKEGKSLADCPIDEKMDGESVGKLWENFLNTDKITKYVEHPYLEEPPMEAPPPPPPPVKLTKKEQKKLRHQRRVAREQEKQEMMRQGVLEPPKPKVKISNMMRVLTEEAVMDPTMIEKKVREEMEERQQAHDDRNLARKLTPAEKREKKIRKLLRDVTSEAGEVFTHVYRIENMRNVKNKFKVDVNAQENHLTGIGIITDTFSIVIVEGTNKGLKRYEKLMMRRIDWTLTNDDYTDEEIERAENNKITLVWKGSGPQRKMKRFRFETLRTEAAARKYLEGDYNCANYFDAAQSAIKYEGDDEEEEDNEEE